MGLLFLLGVLYFTYAWYQWRSENTNVVMTIQEAAMECVLGPDVNVYNIGPVLNIEDGVKVEFSIKNAVSSVTTTSLTLNIESISATLLVESFKYVLVQDTNGGTDYNYSSPVVQGNFSTFNVGANTISASVSIEAEKTYSYQFIVYIDGSMPNNENMMENSMVAALEVGSCGVVTKDANPNAPNLDNNNLIPVYYDNTNEVWKKADSTNANNSWYDYDNKMWANAVLIKDDTARATYQSVTKDTPITESDISAFLVWIPRYKYRVWNITRQGGTEDTYAYPAYTNGIDIEWESGTTSTGNVECDYNVENSTPDTTLSDVCVYNETTTITPESGNTNFTDAWYTHPAFTFNSSNKTGFWIGKFETTGTADVPTVLPDTTALTNQNVSTQFTTSRVFQTYGLSSSVDAHMLTNLEWGSMAYLTHSIYGLCDGTTCRDAYINNSSGKYTGRSAGVLAPSSSSSTYGTYNYKGYQLDSSSGSTTGTKTENLVASSTGNISGVYDISGGSFEYVMANQVDSSNNFNPSFAGDSWNGSTTPSTFYYNPYSYGESYDDQTAFNRSILGDATAEATGGPANNSVAWQPGTGITGSYSGFVDSLDPWFVRGGGYYGTNSGSFIFNTSDGDDSDTYSFRLSVS